ncbi:unnamed protein product, partial [Didymodactylos carnosus]
TMSNTDKSSLSSDEHIRYTLASNADADTDSDYNVDHDDQDDNMAHSSGNDNEVDDSDTLVNAEWIQGDLEADLPHFDGTFELSEGNRIDELLHTLHFNDNVLNAATRDKIQPLSDLFNKRCAVLVDQEVHISADDQRKTVTP